MKEIIEKLWNGFFAEECAVIETMEEKAFVKKAAVMNKKVNELLTEEQKESVEKYIELLYEIQGCFVKKAFFKGCEFATSFFLLGDKF